MEQSDHKMIFIFSVAVNVSAEKHFHHNLRGKDLLGFVFFQTRMQVQQPGETNEAVLLHPREHSCNPPERRSVLKQVACRA